MTKRPPNELTTTQDMHILQYLPLFLPSCVSLPPYLQLLIPKYGPLVLRPLSVHFIR